MTIAQTVADAREHLQAGRLPDAEAGARRVLAVDPNQPDALQLLAAIAYRVGRMDVAIDLLRRVISLQPKSTELLNDLGNMLVAARRFDESIAAYQQAIALAPNGASFHYNLGNALREKGRVDEAIESFRHAIRHRPGYPNALNNLGNLLRERGQFDEAIELFRKAIELMPQMPAARFNLARALHNSGNVEQSVAMLRQVIAMHPDYAEACNNLGVVLEEQSELTEAHAILEKAKALKPDWSVTHYNLGNVQRATGQFHQAVKSYEAALSLDPEYALAHYNHGLTNLLLGDWLAGWPGYEWRWKALSKPQPEFGCPRWNPGAPGLDGRPVLIHAEQGFGDTLNFVRFVPLVAQAGGKVVFTCPMELNRLLRQVPGIDRLISNEELLNVKISTHCPLMSLPGVLGTTLQNVPAAAPYLKADPLLSEAWRQRLPRDGRKKIGIVWAGRGGDRAHARRSMPRRLFRPLAEIENVTLVSLQKGASPDDDDDAGPLDLLDFTSDLNDFSDTAALIDNLDLVITIDSAVAHLAGAMGKPVWTLLVFVPDWRWLLDREDSVWYPTMRLFRQPKIGDWETPMNRVVEALKEFAG